MKCDAFKSKLLKCRTYAEAAPILESMNLGPAVHSLARTAFSLTPEQQVYKENFLADIIREAEMKEEEKVKMTEEEEEKVKEEEEKKMHEYEGGTGTISSDPGMEHLQRKDKSTTSGEHPDTGFNSPENQMRESLRRQGIPESIINNVVKEMDKTTATTRQMVETIDSSIKRYVGPLVAELKKHREALIATDKKLKELASKSNSMPLNVTPVAAATNRVRETDSFNLGSVFDVKRRPSLEDTRNEIKELDNAITNGLLKRTEPYQ